MNPDALRADIENADKALKKEELTAPSVPVNTTVRTYASDIANMMKREKGSIIKIALAEQKRRDNAAARRNPTSTKNVVVVMLGVALIVGGVMIFVSSVMSRGKPVTVVDTTTNLPSLFFTENQIQIDMTEASRTRLIEAISLQTENRTLVPGTMNNLYISYQAPTGQVQAPAQMFLQKLGIETPDDLFQNLYPGFMLGVYAKADVNDLFLILRVKDFTEGFASFRSWEPKMLAEFVRLFAIDTGPYGKDIFSQPFTSQTIANKEARFILDKTGSPVFGYVILDPKTILIGTSTAYVEEIAKRMNLQSIK